LKSPSVAFLLLFAAASVATAQSTPVAPPAPTAVTPSTRPGKPCVAANRKLDREQKALESAQAEIARNRKLQQGCTSKSACARYASALESLDKRVARHELRIDKFATSRDDACKAT